MRNDSFCGNSTTLAGLNLNHVRFFTIIATLATNTVWNYSKKAKQYDVNIIMKNLQYENLNFYINWSIKSTSVRKVAIIMVVGKLW